MPSVKIVIPTYKNFRSLKQCVETLYPFLPDNANILIIDDGSPRRIQEKIRELKSEYDFSVYFKGANSGFSKTCNTGMRISDDDYVLLLNNDIIVESEFIEQMISVADNKEAGIVGARLLYPDESVQHGGMHYSYKNPGWFDNWYRYEIKDVEEVKRNYYCTAVTGACMLIKQDTIDEIGYLDEDFIHGFEDCDYCLRAWRAGIRVAYCWDTQLIHPEGTTLEHNKERELKKQSRKIFWDKWSLLEIENIKKLIEKIGGKVKWRSTHGDQ